MVLKLYRMIAKRFVNFSNRHEMNEHVTLHVMVAGRKLHKNARSILDMIAKHSVKFGGVSWLSEATIARMIRIHQDTVKRALKRLQELKIVRMEVVEVSGLKLSYIVLNRFEIAEDLQDELLDQKIESKPTATKDEATLEVTETKETIQTTDQVLSKDVSEPDTLDASFCPSNVPDEFLKTAKPFFNSAQAIYSLWGKVLMVYRTNKLSTPLDVSIAIKAFKQAIFLQKSGKLRKDIGAYFYGTLDRLFVVEKRREINKKPYFLEGIGI